MIQVGPWLMGMVQESVSIESGGISVSGVDGSNSDTGRRMCHAVIRA